MMSGLDPLNIPRYWQDLPHQQDALMWWWYQTPEGVRDTFAQMWRFSPTDCLAERLIGSVPNDRTFTGKTRRDNAQTSIPLLLAACQEFGVRDPNHIAYIMGTVSHECAFAPVKEIRADRQRNPRVWALQERYWPSGYFGRGYVQITWRDNYQKMGSRLGIPLVEQPDLALDPRDAASICVVGMAEGMFTGRRLAQYDRPGGEFDWVGSRAIVNGSDRAGLIAGYARYYRRFVG